MRWFRVENSGFFLYSSAIIGIMENFIEETIIKQQYRGHTKILELKICVIFTWMAIVRSQY
jgi:hypothetical protein